jgi:hypothetical protein
MDWRPTVSRLLRYRQGPSERPGTARTPCYVAAALGRHWTARRFRLRTPAICTLTVALAASLVACGGDSSSDAGAEVSGDFPVRVTAVAFPTGQRLGETSLLRLGVRNTGRRTVPALTVTISIGGREGRTSSLPFTIHDPQPGLAQPDRPVWVLANEYPKLAGSSEPSGAQSANQKTFDFGALKPGRTVDAIWKLTAVKEGDFTLLYSIDAGLGGEAKAVTGGGAEPGGSFRVRISAETPNTIVTDSGEVVEVDKKQRR